MGPAHLAAIRVIAHKGSKGWYPRGFSGVSKMAKGRHAIAYNQAVTLPINTKTSLDSVSIFAILWQAFKLGIVKFMGLQRLAQSCHAAPRCDVGFL